MSFSSLSLKVSFVVGNVSAVDSAFTGFSSMGGRETWVEPGVTGVATGGGMFSKAVWRWAWKKRIEAFVRLSDLSPTVCF